MGTVGWTLDPQISLLAGCRAARSHLPGVWLDLVPSQVLTAAQCHCYQVFQRRDPRNQVVVCLHACAHMVVCRDKAQSPSDFCRICLVIL